ncbi:hypothetical protein HY251_18080 [bacterium]|nr:hypothetical protein [bacterium]
MRSPASRRVLALAILLATATLATAVVLTVLERQRLARGPDSPGFDAGLAWLARHQSDDGGWEPDAAAACSHSECSCGWLPQSRVTLSSECVLAFLGAGQTPSSRTTYVDPVNGRTYAHGRTVRRGLEFLIASQKEAEGEDEARVLDRALLALALSEAYGITNAVAYRAPAQRALDRLEACRHPGGGWSATEGGPEDTFSTASGVMAMRSGEVSGLVVPGNACIEATRALYEPPCREPDSYASALRLVSAIFSYKKKGFAYMYEDAASAALDPPSLLKPEFDRWSWGTIALFQYDGPSGPVWKPWNTRLCAALLPLRCEEGCAAGSWAPDASPSPGGRVHATATNIGTLQIYYRYASVYGSDKDR